MNTLKKIVLIVLPVVVIFYLAATRGLYFFPPSLALGPCLPDWTSPSTYLNLVSEVASPMGKTRFGVGDADIQVCYGQPSARGRLVFDSLPGSKQDTVSGAPLVPNGRLWRLGANEPTRLFVSRSIRFGNLTVPSGRYALYARPDSSWWEIFVTGSTFHWGNMIGPDVRKQEIGSILVPVSATRYHTERLTIDAFSSSADSTILAIRWADRELKIPIQSPEDDVGS